MFYILPTSSFFFFTTTATTEIYTLSLHDALPISVKYLDREKGTFVLKPANKAYPVIRDRNSTRLNSSHANISYAVFCLKKKKKKTDTDPDLPDQIIREFLLGIIMDQSLQAILFAE